MTLLCIQAVPPELTLSDIYRVDKNNQILFFYEHSWGKTILLTLVW